MKKKQRCFIKRFAALVAALMLCASLSVPCFASNNASTKKWVVVAEELRRGENGALTTYFKLSPYSNGQLYQTIFTSRFSAARKTLLGRQVADIWAQPYNYPDWWRADIPLGATAYVEFSNFSNLSGSYNGSMPSRLMFVPIYRPYMMDFTFSAYSSAISFSGPLSVVPVAYRRVLDDSVNSVSIDNSGFVFSASEVSSSLVVVGSLQGKQNLYFTPFVAGSKNTDFDITVDEPFMNCSSSDLAWIICPASTDLLSTYYDSVQELSIRATMSYWVDANKLPSGLEVGDEFPADTDAFDQLRDNLIDQFPEASENIENGKSTLTGWNDTETVDTDVASSAMSALNAMFQNLGSFLFIISLMVFGAVVLRMFIKKAVDG